VLNEPTDKTAADFEDELKRTSRDRYTLPQEMLRTKPTSLLGRAAGLPIQGPPLPQKIWPYGWNTYFPENEP
jgi:hypothetical protein